MFYTGFYTYIKALVVFTSCTQKQKKNDSCQDTQILLKNNLVGDF